MVIAKYLRDDSVKVGLGAIVARNIELDLSIRLRR